MLYVPAHSCGNQGGNMKTYGPVDEATLPDIARRRFLTAGALLVGFSLAAPARAFMREPDLAAVGALDASGTGFDGFVPNGFIRIGVDGRIVLVVPSVEMGQGIATGEAMMLAEELEVELDQVEVVMAPADAHAYTQSLLKAQATGGSTSVRAYFGPLRSAGAAARTMLVGAAAERWHVPATECSVSRAIITHDPTGRTLSFGAVASAARRQPMPTRVALKPPSRFRLIGKSTKRVDTPAKVDGTATFGIDVHVAGMRVAALVMSPTIGGKVHRVDDRAARAMPGVIDVLRIDDAVAVVGENYWIARRALAQLQVEWEAGPNAALTSSALANQLRDARGTPILGKQVGDPERKLNEASNHRIDSVYTLPYLAHAALEPINTTVHVRPDGCDIWVGTQVPQTARIVAAQITGLSMEQVVVRNHLIGGGFGRRLAVDTIEQAVRFARQVTYPLKVIWTREQDIQHDRFRPAYHDTISATLGADGMPAAWIHRTRCSTVRSYYDRKPWPQGQLDHDAVAGAADLPYEIAAMRSDWVRQDGPVALNWWRGVGETHNVFVVESFLDELAHAAKRDPIEYRRALLRQNPRSLAVLDRAAKAAGWGDPLPPRCGRGVSLHDSFGTHAALVVEIEVDPQGDIRLRRATAVVDCGIAVNPDSVVAQVQGGVLFGLSAALYNAITIENGVVQQSNFHDYRQIRMNEVPPFEVIVMPSEESPGGLGEVGTVSAAPALANAIFAATGVRQRSLPINRLALAIKGENRRPPSISAFDGRRA
ncbi:xanthine dehydrogenase family protein molybdopterin-binding subunit [Burkholderia contaminans]|uniref:xanthine dehydrogenase family protein molybdopterin-binding subunit n=1 Tax=Burkholderia contaminans TaxID=488447 RepID=UPI001F3EFB3C|nr:xanthine dehydrogenase family protein molybdopterin-binding subunit [Burkholderia contaminans]MEB4642576.1 xanthine dehydrogenase family protein molybdopterin-binding subunit [Burkholderia contaminans]MEB4657593.1 xanthine dehydrogenase family protein molybdopterin-binding subunit [Burkholderia contaminans]MEB4658941.1 xanthine dehydrogenase family protein molybdopterin-binding subunit [Burkholderia contaminans]MEB4672925.1 xanthine dehydrogenase family protein molybdopterin-binding subunit 